MIPANGNIPVDAISYYLVPPTIHTLFIISAKIELIRIHDLHLFANMNMHMDINCHFFHDFKTKPTAFFYRGCISSTSIL